MAETFDVGNPGLSWHVVAAGGLNGDGKSDILFQNDSGEIFYWVMDGPNILSSGSLGNLGSTLHFVATGDFTGSGLADFLFQDSSGEVDIVGTGVIGTVGNPGPSWHVIGTGDYNGDGNSGILFQNSSGEVAIWDLNGASVIGNASLGNPGPTWHVQPDDGFYQPERADLPWQTDGSAVVFLQNDSGEAFLWNTNGAGITGAGSLGNPGPDWHVKATGDFNGDGNPDLLWQNDTGRRIYLGIERDHPDRCRQHRQSGPELAHHFGRRFQPRWSIGHPVPEQ